MQCAPIGVVHGRFQVLHRGHMEYLMAGKAKCKLLLVGITNADPSVTAHHPSNPHRSLPENNPLTYFERATIARDAMLGAGVPLDEFMVVPFPINRPKLLRYYAPPEATFFLTIYDDWGRAKLGILQALGLKTDVLWERQSSEKLYSATDVRACMARGESWEAMVPDSVAHAIKRLGIDRRIADQSCATKVADGR